MSYEKKISDLTEALAEYVKFDSLAQAEEYATAYKQPVDHEDWVSLSSCAEKILLFAEQLGLSSVLAVIGGCNRTKLSAIREALRALAIRRLERHQEYLDRLLGCEPLPV